MKAERLKKIEEICHAALEIPPDERDSFLANACGTDDDLRREVESLLSFENSSESFLETPPESLAAEMFDENQTNLIGAEFKHYKIVKLLGKGGMGEVYLAEDTKLDRKVALKFLPPEFAADKNRLNRFFREAKSASALNHPNIVTIHEIGQTDGKHFIVTEFVEGKTLREAMPENGFSIEQSLKIAVQIASGLEAAQTAGFIHRDIKPENIMIRTDGLVKILDFGLAKLQEGEKGRKGEEEKSDSQISTSPTIPGMIMGTAAYMSPEQARGKMVDGRTDIWSLGVVLAEVLTGKTPFAGDTTNDIIASILKSSAVLDERIPDELKRIINRALEKDVELRYQTAFEFRAELKRLLRDSDTTLLNFAVTDRNLPPVKTNTSFILKSKKMLFGGLALLAIFVIVGGFYWKYFYDQKNSVNSFQTLKIDRLTAHGLTVAIAISPDGKYIAYAKNDDGKYSLWLRQTASSGETQIAPAGNLKYSFLKFSPDGEFIYFVGSEGEQPLALYQINSLGRNQRKLVDGVNSQISFSPDGKQLVFVRKKDPENFLIIADVEGQNERILATRKSPDVYTEGVSWSPDGKRIAVGTLKRRTNFAGGIATVDVENGTEMPIALSEKMIRVSHLVWTNDGGGLIFCQFASPTGQRYQLRYADFPSGKIQNVTNDLTSYEDLSLTADAKTLVSIQREYLMGIWLTEENDFTKAAEINTKTGRDDGEHGISWTKDGKIVYVSSENDAQNIWRMDADGSNQKPLTTGNEEGKYLPSLEIGGDALIFTNHFDYWQMNADGQNQQKITNDGNCQFTPSANENWIVYTSDLGGKRRIWKIPRQGGEAVKLTETDSSHPAISPDGKLIGYFQTEKGQPIKLAVISIDGGAPIKTFELPPTVSAQVEAGIAWNKEGNAIFFLDTIGIVSNIWKQTLDGTKANPVTAFKEFRIANFALNPEGNRLAISRGSRNRDIVLIRNIQ